MTIKHYRYAISMLIDETENENLLMLWKEQKEWDLAHPKKASVIFFKNWQQIPDDYVNIKTNKVISLKEFVDRKKLTN